jgi:hypothetical protein
MLTTVLPLRITIWRLTRRHIPRVATGRSIFRLGVIMVGLIEIAAWEKTWRWCPSTSDNLESLALVLGLALEQATEPASGRRNGSGRISRTGLQFASCTGMGKRRSAHTVVEINLANSVVLSLLGVLHLHIILRRG